MIKQDNLYIFSFFSGSGFLDLGFESAGFNISFVNEFSPDFMAAYQYSRKSNYPYHYICVRGQKSVPKRRRRSVLASTAFFYA